MSKAKLQNGFLTGEINTLEHYFGFELSKINNAQSDKAPTHEIMAKKSNGTFVKIGVAWERQMSRGDFNGHSMFSLSFDDPRFSEKLNFSCFPEDNDGNYSVNFERPRQNAPVNNSGLSALAPPPSQEAQAGQEANA